VQSSASGRQKLLPTEKQVITARQELKIAIKEQITLIYFGAKQRYGSPRITLELRNIGYEISRPESFTRTGKAISSKIAVSLRSFPLFFAAAPVPRWLSESVHQTLHSTKKNSSFKISSYFFTLPRSSSPDTIFLRSAERAHVLINKIMYLEKTLCLSFDSALK
jgi:hypothetical protein